MGLKRLISALLPRAYREQVLGDLEERGFLPHDMLSTVPRVWWTALRRALQPPNWTAASEAMLRQRATTFARRRQVRMAVPFAGYPAILWIYGVPWMALAAFAFLGGTLALGWWARDKRLDLPPSPPQNRDQWIAFHRQQLLDAEKRGPFALGPLAVLRTHYSRSNGVHWSLSLFAAIPLIWIVRTARLRRERNSLQ